MEQDFPGSIELRCALGESYDQQSQNVIPLSFELGGNMISASIFKKQNATYYFKGKGSSGGRRDVSTSLATLLNPNATTADRAVVCGIMEQENCKAFKELKCQCMFPTLLRGPMATRHQHRKLHLLDKEDNGVLPIGSMHGLAYTDLITRFICYMLLTTEYNGDLPFSGAPTPDGELVVMVWMWLDLVSVGAHEAALSAHTDLLTSQVVQGCQRSKAPWLVPGIGQVAPDQKYLLQHLWSSVRMNLTHAKGNQHGEKKGVNHSTKDGQDRNAMMQKLAMKVNVASKMLTSLSVVGGSEGAGASLSDLRGLQALYMQKWSDTGAAVTTAAAGTAQGGVAAATGNYPIDTLANMAGVTSQCASSLLTLKDRQSLYLTYTDKLSAFGSHASPVVPIGLFMAMGA
ncbi:hypothetical protein VOLCADRAFT_97813 [Volvox carteri f. nagariensis]|uniref:Uncharacterized protein n=1 Tax=Volvox carteri f. nagariensis TaxID=3068 RepID=D8UDP7_VOLCA|nr:uncharacterized protein VOLCADRAFT_97813 [Volvox carteri f. nagariensis]EFJ42132.1 hypothetical protein VOLCADRAFT_97813 [Volvox carteri f. nagariensis]|eukprot:XP_002956829.1 hypothetical protein VOLCADRAFT_97813 [Volvox carteri f. nagariensis]